MEFRTIKSNKPGNCPICGKYKPKRSNVRYYKATRQTTCLDCPIEDESVNTMPDPGEIASEQFIAANL